MEKTQIHRLPVFNRQKRLVGMSAPTSKTPS
jgi:hypothetical protein